MAHIHHSQHVAAGYFHAAGDSEKTATARRATYTPSLTDRITNRFARDGHPRLASFASSVRQFGLSRRVTSNARDLAGARARFEAMALGGHASQEELAAAQDEKALLEHTGQRLGEKQVLSTMARSGELDEGVQQFSASLQQQLRNDGFVPLAGLRGTAHDQIESKYLVSEDDGHRIKINTEKPPLLARMVADSVSAGYDRGASGAGRAMRSAMQHALVGVYSAEQAVKGMVARELAGSRHLDQGAQIGMNLRQARTEGNRAMARAALGGNVALNQEYARVAREQQDRGLDRLFNPEGPRYALRSGVGGSTPPHVSFIERKVDAYFRPRAQAADAPGQEPQAGAPAPQQRRGHAIARFAVSLLDLHGKRTQRHHASAAEHAMISRRASADPAERDRLDALQARHEAGAAKAEYGRTIRRSMLQGRLLETLGDEAARERLEAAAPQVRIPLDDSDQPRHEQDGDAQAGRREG